MGVQEFCAVPTVPDTQLEATVLTVSSIICFETFKTFEERSAQNEQQPSEHIIPMTSTTSAGCAIPEVIGFARRPLTYMGANIFRRRHEWQHPCFC